MEEHLKISIDVWVNKNHNRAVIRNNIIIYTVSVLIVFMAASIIFLSAGSRRVFPVEIFLSRDGAPMSAMFIVSSTSSLFC